MSIIKSQGYILSSAICIVVTLILNPVIDFLLHIHHKVQTNQLVHFIFTRTPSNLIMISNLPLIILFIFRFAIPRMIYASLIDLILLYCHSRIIVARNNQPLINQVHFFYFKVALIYPSDNFSNKTFIIQQGILFLYWPTGNIISLLANREYYQENPRCEQFGNILCQINNVSKAIPA